MVQYYNGFKAGNIKGRTKYWREIDCNPEILKWIECGVQLPFTSSPHRIFIPNKKHNFKESQFLDQEIKSLVKQGAIKPVVKQPYCVSSISCVPKKGGSYRIITDLREVNKYCPCPHFRYEDINEVIENLRVNDNLITYDIKQGYLHVPVHESFKSYLGFKWKNQYYEWQVLPFGLAVSGYFFVKIVREVVNHLRAAGIRISSYVDDFLLGAPVQDIETHHNIVISLFHRLGIILNTEKCSFLPEKVKVYVGYIISTDGALHLQIPKERIKKLHKDIAKVIRTKSATARQLARIAGQCISMAKAVIPAKLLLRNVYRLLSSKESWQSNLTIDKDTLNDLIWWQNALVNWNGAIIKPQIIEASITTDASAIGWGAHCAGEMAQGFWNTRIKYKSSNYRELMAILMAMYTFARKLKGQTVKIYTDNICASAYVAFQGGSSKELTQIATAIWSIALEFNITILIAFIAGQDNTLADRLSRLNPAYEWKLNPRLFHLINSVHGPHTIDRFASMLNAQLPRYNSRYADPFSDGVDALGQLNWGRENNFVNPPMRLIPAVLRVVQAQQAWATIIAPYWKGAHWMQDLKRLSVAPPIRIPNVRKTCLTFRGTPEPRRNRKWKLFAWRIYGGTRPYS